MALAELAQEMWKRADSLDHLAEMERPMLRPQIGAGA
jgi:hypothetical protein